MNLINSLLLSTAFATTSKAFAPISSNRVIGTSHVTVPVRSKESCLHVRLPNFNQDEVEEELVATSTSTTKQTNPFSELLSGLPSLDNFDVSKLDISTVLENLNEDGSKFGERGEFYFLAQAALLVCIIFGGIPIVGDVLSILGPLSLLAGVGVVAAAALDLGSDSLSPYPATTSTSTLKTTGIYKELRHPMYTGNLLLMLGLAIVTNSATRLLLTVALGYLLEVKATKEEEFLVERFPEYKDYQQQVPQKFFPSTLMKQLPWNK
eukprot:scaffold5966_cov118-Cylindrotheca_fusiformis.AAC.17